MSTHDAISQAIREKRILQFFYDGGTRVVEPHQLAYNQKGNIALSAYWLRGYSESQDMSNRWREYLIDHMNSISVLEEHFIGPRPGYKKSPNKSFHSAICEL